MAFGIDYVTGPPISVLQEAGVTFVCRYLSFVNDLTKIKLLTANEAQELSQANMALVSNYEWYADRATEGVASGVQDAQIARDQHAVCGGPSDRPIYFSVDEDIDGSQVADYFRGVASVIGLSRTGAYGSYRVIKYLFDQGLIAWGWQTYAWSGGAWESRAHIQQYQNDAMLEGISVDYNRSMKSDFGQWLIVGGNNIDMEINSKGEVAEFADAEQFPYGKSQFMCGYFACYIAKSMAPVGQTPLLTSQQIIDKAEVAYTQYDGSDDISNTDGMTLDQEYSLLQQIGLHYQALPLDMSLVKGWLKAGYPVLVAIPEVSVIDLELGETPYTSWTPSGTHIILLTGIMSDGNVLARDSANCTDLYDPNSLRPGPRKYKADALQLVSATIVVPPWMPRPTSTTPPTGDISMIPTGWSDDGTTLTAPNGVKVVLGFRNYILNHAWDASDVPLAPEISANPVEIGYSQKDGHNDGTRQIFMYSELGYTSTRGVYRISVGREFATALQQLATAQQPSVNIALATSELQALQGVIDSGFAKVLSDLGKH